MATSKKRLEWNKLHRKEIQEYNKKYKKKNHGKLLPKKLEWDKAHPDKVKEQHKRDYEKHKDERLSHQKEYYLDTIEERKEWQRKYYAEHDRSGYNKEHYLLNREKSLATMKAYYEENGEAMRANARERYALHKDDISLYNKTPKGKFQNYKGQAKHRGLSFEITYDEFLSFWQKPCSYCKSPVETVGLDRIDNGVGYTLLNIVAACSDCNYARGDIFTYEEMLKEIGPSISRAKAARTPR